MLIRPHHLWVLQGIIERHGNVSHIQVSSKKELEPWKKIYQALIQNPNLEITIVGSIDYICERCPESDGNKCKKYSRLDDVDNEAISTYELKYGLIYSSRELIRRLREKICAE